MDYPEVTHCRGNLHLSAHSLPSESIGHNRISLRNLKKVRKKCTEIPIEIVSNSNRSLRCFLFFLLFANLQTLKETTRNKIARSRSKQELNTKRPNTRAMVNFFLLFEDVLEFGVDFLLWLC